MESNELRIGNWVTSIKSLPFQVSAHHLYMMVNYESESDLNYRELTQPIPLTEEWLLRFGATKRIVSEWGFHIKIGSVKIYFRKNIQWYSELEGIYLGSHIQYVHQLQNIVFALTGNELVLQEGGVVLNSNTLTDHDQESKPSPRENDF